MSTNNNEHLGATNKLYVNHLYMNSQEIHLKALEEWVRSKNHKEMEINDNKNEMLDLHVLLVN